MSTIDDELSKIREKINQIKEEVQKKEIPSHQEPETVSTFGIDGEDINHIAEKIREEINTNLRKSIEKARENIRKNNDKIRKKALKNSMNIIPPLFPLIAETQKVAGTVMENAREIIEKAFEPLEDINNKFENIDFNDREKLIRMKIEAINKIGEQLKKGFANMDIKIDLDEFGEDKDEFVEDILESIEDTFDETVEQIDETFDTVTEIIEEVTEEIEGIKDEIEEGEDIEVQWEDEQEN